MFNSAVSSTTTAGLATGALGGTAQCANGLAVAAGTCTVTNTRVNEWGGGFVQEIDAAAMSLWVQAEHFDAKDTGCTGGVTATGGCVATGAGSTDVAHSAFNGMTVVKFGGLINF